MVSREGREKEILKAVMLNLFQHDDQRGVHAVARRGEEPEFPAPH